MSFKKKKNFSACRVRRRRHSFTHRIKLDLITYWWRFSVGTTPIKNENENERIQIKVNREKKKKISDYNNSKTHHISTHVNRNCIGMLSNCIVNKMRAQTCCQIIHPWGVRYRKHQVKLLHNNNKTICMR